MLTLTPEQRRPSIPDRPARATPASPPSPNPDAPPVGSDAYEAPTAWKSSDLVASSFPLTSPTLQSLPVLPRPSFQSSRPLPSTVAASGPTYSRTSSKRLWHRATRDRIPNGSGSQDGDIPKGTNKKNTTITKRTTTGILRGSCKAATCFLKTTEKKKVPNEKESCRSVFASHQGGETRTPSR